MAAMPHRNKPMVSAPQRILVIKHGALGDIILASAGFKAIRAAYPNAHITCLTTKGYAGLMQQCPWFDAVITDPKPKPWQWGKIRTLIGQLNQPRFDVVFDLQTSTRSSSYWWLLASPTPSFSGVTPFGDLAYTDPARHGRHAHDNLVRQLTIAGLHDVGLPDIAWLNGDITALKPHTPYALIVPGGAAHRPEKRWPAQYFATLVTALAARGITPVLLGTEAEAEVIASIMAQAPQAVSLAGKTSIGQIAALARSAACAVGNDTGPMHVIAAAGAPSTVLFSHASSPERSAPVGPHVITIQADDMRTLTPEAVLKTLPDSTKTTKTA